jgi:hypothetical protein
MLNVPADKFRAELDPGEYILWSGQPQQGLLLRPSDALMIPFSLMWGGFAIVWEAAVLSNGPDFFALWGIPFVLAGLYMIFGRFFVDMEVRRKTYYALTNERAIIISGIINQNTRSLKLKNLPEINLTTRSNGRGTITFGSLHPMSWVYNASMFPNTGRVPVAPSFDLIDDVRSVYQKIKGLQGEVV